MQALAFDAGPWVPDPWDGNPDALPDWWLRAAAGDEVNVSAEQMTAFAAAHGRVTRFRGSRLTQDGAAFVRAAVRDALYAAPQPVTKHWVNYSLSVIARLVGMCEQAAIPLERQYVFTPRTRQRFIHVACADMVDMAQAGYRSRLDVISDALRRAPQHLTMDRPGICANDVLAPYTEADEIGMVAWAAGTRPASRRNRLRAVIALGAGVGERRRDMCITRGSDVIRDRHGVHVNIGGTLPRTVTCLAAYEEILWEHAQAAGNGLIIAPDKTWLDEDALSNTLATANEQRPPVPVVIMRLRNTWLAHHLVGGTPLTALLPAAGLTTLAHLQDLLPHLPVSARPAGSLRKAGA